MTYNNGIEKYIEKYMMIVFDEIYLVVNNTNL